MGVVLPQPGFLEGLQALCRKDGALLIFDEVMTGFRVAYGGAQGRFGIKPDLTTLGKIIGGGMPVGAYGGRADVMHCISPLGPVYQAGTLSGNPLAMACGLATLRDPQKDRIPIRRLERETQRLAEGFRQAAQAAGIAHTVAHVGSMFTLFFHDAPVTNYSIAAKCDTQRFSRYFWGMIERGIYLPVQPVRGEFRFGGAYTRRYRGHDQCGARRIRRPYVTRAVSGQRGVATLSNWRICGVSSSFAERL